MRRSALASDSARRASLVVSAILAVAFAFTAWHVARDGLPRFDEAFLLYGVERVRAGALPIADFQSYDIGRYYLLQPFYWLAGARGVFAGGHFLVAGAVIVLVAACEPALRGRWQPATAGLLATTLLVWGSIPRHKAIDQAVLLLVTAAFVHLFDARRPRAWFLVGVATGLAAVVGRNHGAYALLALGLSAGILFSRSRESDSHAPKARVALRNASVGIALGWAPVAMLLLLRGDFRRAYSDLLARDLGSGTNIPLPTPWPWTPQGGFLDATSLGFVLMPTAIVVAAIIVVLRRDDLSGDHRLATVGGASVVGLPYLHHAFSRADLAHLAQASAPGVVVAVVLVVTALNRWSWSAAVPTVVAGVLVLVLLAAGPLHRWGRYDVVRTLRGSPGLVEVEVGGEPRLLRAGDLRYLRFIEALTEQIPREDVVLALPREVGVYLYTGRVAPIPQTYLTGNTNETEQRQMAGLVKSVDWLVLDPEAYGRNPMTRFATAYPLVWEVLAVRCEEVVPAWIVDQPYEVRRCFG